METKAFIFPLSIFCLLLGLAMSCQKSFYSENCEETKDYFGETVYWTCSGETFSAEGKKLMLFAKTPAKFFTSEKDFFQKEYIPPKQLLKICGCFSASYWFLIDEKGEVKEIYLMRINGIGNPLSESILPSLTAVTEKMREGWTPAKSEGKPVLSFGTAYFRFGTDCD